MDLSTFGKLYSGGKSDVLFHITRYTEGDINVLIKNISGKKYFKATLIHTIKSNKTKERQKRKNDK